MPDSARIVTMSDMDALPLPMDMDRQVMVRQKLRDIAVEVMPEPYHSLLVHNRDMTGTLEAFYGDTLKLRVLASDRNGDEHMRRVLLETVGDQTIVEYGGICIYLTSFSENARERILAGSQPLGGILTELNIPFTSAPDRFIALDADQELCQLLGMSHSATLYGRTNVLRRPDGVPLAEIVEILPTLNETKTLKL
jgi:chorismate-pyruvate lyase